MSLFKWSTPERRIDDRILPIVPNEIYLHILDLILPVSGRPLPEELDTLTRLSLVCRFFANICLPRIFEHVEFSGAIFRDDTPLSLRNDATYRASRESTLCEQVSAKQPLALSLVQCVKVCYFTDWKLDGAGSWAVRIFVQKYLSGLTHMKDIRRLEFSWSFVDIEHWRAIATLQSLEELCFDSCNFLRGPAELERGKTVKVKISHLQVTDCRGEQHPAAAVDARFLRSVTTDSELTTWIDWAPQSVLKELHIQVGKTGVPMIEHLHRVLRKLPPSLEVLSLPMSIPGVRTARLFNEPVWRNWPFLRSLSLRIHLCVPLSATVDIIPRVLASIQHCTSLESLTITDSMMSRDIIMTISANELRDILRRKLESTSGLKYLDIYGVVLRLVDGEWTEVPCDST